MSLKVTGVGGDIAGDVSAVHVLSDANCNGQIDGADADIVAARPFAAGATVTFSNGGSPLVGFSAGAPACLIIAYDIPLTATVGNLVRAEISSTFDLGSSFGPYPFPSTTGYPIASADVAIVAEGVPDLALDKSVSPDQASYEVGSTVTYNLRVNNDGDADASNVDIWDELDPVWEPYTGVITPRDGGALCLPPACATPRVTWPAIATLLAGGAPQTRSFEAVIPLDLPDGASIPNTAATTAAEVPAAVASNQHTLPVCSPIIAFTKTVDKSTSTVGEAIEWTMTVNNTAACAASAVVVRDSVDVSKLDEATLVWTPASGTYDAASHTYTWPGASLAGAGAATLTYKVKGTILKTAGGSQVCDTGRMSWDQATAEQLSNSGSATCASICAPLLSFNKSLAKSSYREGETIAWTMALLNTAACAATGVVVRDLIDVNPLDEATLVFTPPSGSYDAVNHVYTWPAMPLAGNAAQALVYTVAATLKDGAAGSRACDTGGVSWDQGLAEQASNAGDATCADVLSACKPIPELGTLKSVKAANLSNVSLSWGTVAAAENGYDVWRVASGAEIPNAQAPGGAAVTSICTLSPFSTCVDPAAVPVAAGAQLYYQVKGVCGSVEGP